MLARFSRLFRCDVHENTPFGKSRHILVMVPLVWVLYCVLISVVIACATFVFFRRKVSQTFKLFSEVCTLTPFVSEF